MLQKPGNKFTFALSLIFIFGLLTVFVMYDPLDFESKNQSEVIQFVDDNSVISSTQE